MNGQKVLLWHQWLLSSLWRLTIECWWCLTKCICDWAKMRVFWYQRLYKLAWRLAFGTDFGMSPFGTVCWAVWACRKSRWCWCLINWSCVRRILLESVLWLSLSWWHMFWGPGFVSMSIQMSGYVMIWMNTQYRKI